MLDIFNIPSQADNIRIFYAAGSTAWQTWTKPRNCKFIWMMCIGGAAGGSLGGIANGGSGGGSGAITRAIFVANVLPDMLFIQPGPGGGSNLVGSRSWVTIVANSTAAMNTVCVSGTTAAGTAVITDGESAATTTVAGLLSLGNFTSMGGNQGVNPGAGLFTPLISLSTVLSGGVGGSTSTTTAGASILSADLTTFSTPLISGGVGTTGGNGGSGIFSFKPLYGLGGAGGGGSTTGVGGTGGNGAYGCGGGGGGWCTSGTSNGGRGGDGLVIIATF